MKSLILALTFALSTTSAFASQQYDKELYKCFLDEVAFSKSPVVTIVYNTKTKLTNLVFINSPSEWRALLTVKVQDNTEDVRTQYDNEEKGISLGFYADENDALGFMEGSVTSPIMNGSVKCLPAL